MDTQSDHLFVYICGDRVEVSKPIGYWLKHLHNLLETHFTMVMSDLGIGRREWQVLHTLSEGRRSLAELEQAIAPFLKSDSGELRKALASLAERGWTEETDGSIALTPYGLAAHAELSYRITETRAAVTQGITPQEYEETIRVLSIMARNLESAIAARTTDHQPGSGADAQLRG